MLSAGTAPDAECVVTADLLEWADDIFVMDAKQKKFLQERFGALLTDKRLICLSIPDRFDYMQPELVDLLRRKLIPYLPERALHDQGGFT